MSKSINRVATDDVLPRSTDVVVIGAGIIGVSAALTLAERGIAVVLIEKGTIAGEQSSRNWGWCRQQGRDPRELPLIIESLRLWRDLNQRIEGETGFRQCGVVYLARTAADLAAHEAWLDLVKTYGVDSRLVDQRELVQLLPESVVTHAGALFTPSDGRAEPTMAVPAMARAARRHGAIVLENTAARGLETRAGSIDTVVTEKGRIDCNGVLLAGGVWSRLFCQPLGIDIPQLKVVSSVLRTQPLPGGPEVSASGHGFSFRKRLDGGYTIAHGGVINYDLVPDSLRLLPRFLPLAWMARHELRPRLSSQFRTEWRQLSSWPLDQPSPFEETRILDPAPLPGVLKAAVRNLKGAYPAFRRLQVAEEWAGMIDVTPDAVPVISTTPDLPGLVLATGFSGHGFGIGPAAGQLAADLVMGAPTSMDVQPFALSRFFDGSKICPVTGI
jgi:glycine/D-amino acid oxidase-like deaminating enzyme